MTAVLKRRLAPQHQKNAYFYTHLYGAIYDICHPSRMMPLCAILRKCTGRDHDACLVLFFSFINSEISCCSAVAMPATSYLVPPAFCMLHLGLEYTEKVVRKLNCLQCFFPPFFKKSPVISFL